MCIDVQKLKKHLDIYNAISPRVEHAKKIGHPAQPGSARFEVQDKRTAKFMAAENPPSKASGEGRALASP